MICKKLRRQGKPCLRFLFIGCHYADSAGTEELAHLEMVGTILYQLTRCLSEEDIRKSGFDTYFVDHAAGVYLQAASGVPTDMKYIGVKGDVFADLNEDLAAEQKARVTYDNLLRLIDDRDVCEPLKFLRQREIVHYQRFGEAIRTNLSNFFGKKRSIGILRNCCVKFLLNMHEFYVIISTLKNIWQYWLILVGSREGMMAIS